ncbi:MAG TPA: glycosyltransferase, partial [Candidatus Sumerlaeota bacterium]|nr:glycosyltransferase [Candidatus Sumerlaeota bacterium]
TYPWARPEHLHAVYHGVDLTAFDEAHDPAVEEPLLLSVGRLCDTKGFPELVEACRLLRERGVAFSCRIVGDGYMRDDLERQIRESGLEGVVTIAGLLPRAAVRDLYRRARLFVLPCVVTSRGDRDGLPNVIVEAMAMGLPVVASNISGIPEAVVEGETGRLTPPHDPGALAEAIQSLWEDPALRARMGRAGHARTRERFGLEHNVALLAALTHRESRAQVSGENVR